MLIAHHVIVGLIVFALVTATRVCLHYRRRWREAANELRASVLAGEELVRDLDSMRQAAIMLEAANYRLACELHGKEAVDRAVQHAKSRGAN
jgi:hypothetical protein